MGNYRTILMAAFCLALSVTGCGSKKKQGTSGSAKLALTNSTSMSLATTLTYYGLKIKTVYISPDEMGAVSAPAGTIWVNPDCSPSTSSTDVDGKMYDYLSNSNCNVNNVKTYFNLARTTEAVNADLNSQNLAILPGSYNYVHIEICSGDLIDTSRTIKYQTSDMAEATELQGSGCTIHSDKTASPIQVSEGGGVIVTLSYDLAGSESGNWPSNLKPSFAAQ